VLLVASLYCLKVQAVVNSSNCGNYSHNTCYYNSSKAVKYAQDHHDTLDSNIFTYYSNYPTQANCANFISQALAAGFTGETNR